VRAALDAPVGAPPLADAAARARRVTVVVPDRTRPARAGIVVAEVLERLVRAGVPADGILVLVGGGIHAPATAADALEILGPDVVSRVRWSACDADDPAAHEPLGGDLPIPGARVHRDAAQADLVVLVGAVAPHYLAGFSAGAKSLVPGCADRATVLAAHRRTLDATVAPDGSVRSLLARPDGNPFRDVLERLARAHGRCWAVVVGLCEGRIAHAAAGDVVDAHRAACAEHRRLKGCARPAPADLVVAGGGYPRDRDLLQAHKSLVVAAEAAKPGAPIVWLAHAGDGAGHPRFLPWFEAGRMDRHLAALRRDFHPYGLTAYALRWKCARFAVHAVSTQSRDVLRPMGLLPFEDAQAALDHALAHHEVRRAVVLPHALETFF
jgi:nickel-dependent lactate racemase